MSDDSKYYPADNGKTFIKGSKDWNPITGSVTDEFYKRKALNPGASDWDIYHSIERHQSWREGWG